MPLDACLWVPGNHLYPLEHYAPYRKLPIVMVEDRTLCTRYPYHQQKLALLLSAMREHAEQLKSARFDVHYVELTKGKDLFNVLQHKLVAGGTLHTFQINDHKLSARLEKLSEQQQWRWESGANPGFLTEQSQFAQSVGKGSTLRMATFYQHQRRRLALLLDQDGKPTGGKWSFDAQNRKKVPARQPLPDLPTIDHSTITHSVIKLVAKEFGDHPGAAEQLWLPTTREGALTWLHQFLTERLVGFGTYEDAITSRSPFVFHSTLSPLINLGLITPEEVVTATVEYSQHHAIPLNDLEGFLRQLIGWREFIRGVYAAVPDQHQHNMRDHQRQLTDHWFDATTGIPPLDLAIRTHLRWGWNHHIERLMVLANLMNLCEIEPQSVYAYFMQHHIDAYDWVMTPNVYGMGLTSDGGIFATKPYIAGSNYLLKMSDFKKGDWCDVVDGLYWRFVANNRAELKKNPRLAAFASGVDRLQPERKERIFAAAEAFLARCTRH